MVDATLDFRFGWRWLLPLQGCRTVHLQGFTEAEQQFWRRTLSPSEIFLDGRTTDAHVIDADCLPQAVSWCAKGFAQARMVCAVGTGAHVAPWRSALSGIFPQVRAYGLLPAGNPRVVVPLDTPRHASIALHLHRPGRRLGRLVVGTARLLAACGVLSPLHRRVLLIAVRDSSAVPQGAFQANVPARLSASPSTYALYLGAAGDNRKTVVLPLGAAAPEIILKVAASPKSRQSLENEVAALKALRQSPITSHVPNLLDLDENAAALTLIQEFRPRQQVARRVLNEAVIDFLQRLSTIDRQSRPLSCVLAEMAPEFSKSSRIDRSDVLRTVWARLQVHAEKGMMIWEHRSHGDFAPWNCAWTKPGLFVHDWEESKERDVAFGDAFYFVVAQAAEVDRHSDPARTQRAALGFANRVAAGGLKQIDLKTHFALWALRRAELATVYGALLSAHLVDWHE